MTKVNLHINRQTLEIREAARDYSIMYEISMWGIATRHRVRGGVHIPHITLKKYIIIYSRILCDLK